ncbi:uncharacterized protein with GYD domain [Paenibacillus mucilaginosus]
MNQQPNQKMTPEEIEKVRKQLEEMGKHMVQAAPTYGTEGSKNS